MCIARMGGKKKKNFFLGKILKNLDEFVMNFKEGKRNQKFYSG